MKKMLLLVLLTFLYANSFSQVEEKVYNSLLKAHVSLNGKVDYKALKKNEEIIDVYLAHLYKQIPGKNWSSNKAKAFWLNAYNAYTVKQVLNHYPVKSIRDIKQGNKNAWEISFAKIGGHTYTLDYIEHKILRRWHDDPRIHVGINSASASGPRFPNFLFTEENVDNKLNYLMKTFVNDRSKNKLSANRVEISKIFDWYKEDFSTSGDLGAYLNKYSVVKIDNSAQIKFMDYDWSLNEYRKQ